MVSWVYFILLWLMSLMGVIVYAHYVVSKAMYEMKHAAEEAVKDIRQQAEGLLKLVAEKYDGGE